MSSATVIGIGVGGPRKGFQAVALSEILVAFQRIDESNEFDCRACRQRLIASPGAASAAADEGDLDITAATGGESMRGGRHGLFRT